MNNHKTNGFTLLEVLIVIAIIAILIAIGIPTYVSMLTHSKESVCLSNRRALLSVIYAEYMTEGYDSPKKAFDAIYKGEDEETYICPESGLFSWINDSGQGGHITCSFHGGDDPGNGEEPGGNTYPGTDISIVNNYWPDDSDFEDQWSSVTVDAGGIFQYTDGNYYVVTKSESITKSQASTGPGGEVYNWYITQKITGKIVTYEGNEQKSDLHRGDICKVGDDNYVYIDGGTYAYSPDRYPSQWYKLP